MTFCLRCTLLLIATLPAFAADITIDNRTFHLPPGFVIEKIAGRPLVNRPITADFDEQGRLYVSDSSGSSEKVQKQLEERPHRILRLEDTNNDGVFDRATVFADKMMFPEGTLWYAGALYVAAPPSIWKLTDTDNDGVADQRGEWFQGKTLTGCANDLHGPYLGPDGWIYWCKGAFAKQTYTLPNGKEFTTRAAHIFRSRPDGTGIEPVMTGGMDNPVEVVFTPGGERIFTTTFLQNPAAGRRDGLIHAVYGGVYGKQHDVIDDHIRTGPDLMPVLSHLGPAASCGLVRYESAVFGKEYQDNLFSSSFNLHKIFRHILTPDVATFKSKDEDFLTCDSLDFHPTHLIEDADGSLIVIDTGGWYKLCCPTSQLGKPDVLGAIYRVRRTDAKKIADPRGLKIAWATLSADDLAKLLGDERPAVAKRAIAALAAFSPSPGTPGESRGEGRAQNDALRAMDRILQSSPNPRARLNAVWAGCRIPGPDARATVRSALSDKDDSVREAALHGVSLWRDPLAVLELIKLLQHPSPHTVRTAIEALGRIGRSEAIGPLLAFPAPKLTDPIINHSLVYALIELNQDGRHAKDYAAVLEDSSRDPLHRRAALVAVDQSGAAGSDPFTTSRQPSIVISLIDSPDRTLRDAAGWIVSRHPEWGDALASDCLRMLTSTAVIERPEAVRTQITSLARSPAVQEVLAQVAGDANAPAQRRQVVLAAIAGTSLKDLPEPWCQTLTNLLSDPDAKIAAASAAALRRYTPKNPPRALIEGLIRLAERTDVSTSARLDALVTLPATNAKDAKDLPALSAKLFDLLVASVGPQAQPSVRLESAEILARSNLTRDQVAALGSVARSAGPLELDRLLATLDQKVVDDELAANLVQSIEKSKAAGSIRPDNLRTRLKRFGPQVQAKAQALLTRLAPDAAKQKAHLDQLVANLSAGDVRRGQLIFNSPKAACASCHAIGYVGGHVGPDLTRIGAIRQERDLLESIAFPSASFVQSFEPIIVETTAGDIHSGILKKNDAQEVILTTGPDAEVRIPRAEVKDMRPGTVSVMPAGLDQQMTPQELADLVAFLKACK
jgi:putative membrane-bound dehydrogenase-like protein